METYCSMKKENPNLFPSWLDVPKSWHTLNGTFQRNERGNLRIKFLDYSASKEYLVQPDIVEYDGTKMGEPGFDCIFSTNILSELGFVLNCQLIEIDIDKIILPMSDITKLSTRSKIKQARIANNSVIDYSWSHTEGCQDLGHEVWKSWSHSSRNLGCKFRWNSGGIPHYSRIFTNSNCNLITVRGGLL